MKTRTQLEIWKVMKDNFDEYFEISLCLLILKLYTTRILSSNEYFILNKELSEYGNTGDYFLGKPKDPKPRLEFIDKMIKKHEQLD